jgi:long-chain acyl-CoA synthetase
MSADPDIGSSCSVFSLHTALRAYASGDPRKPALVTYTRTVTYSQLEELVSRLVEQLLDLTNGSAVVIWSFLRKDIEFVAAFIAAQELGCTFVPLAPDSNAARLSPLAEALSPGVLLVSASEAARISQLVSVLGITVSQPVAYLQNGVACLCSDTAPTHLHGGAYVNFTSGTTAPSKGALCTTDTLFWNTKAVTQRFRLSGDDVHLSTFPVHIHPHEFFARAVYLGGTAVLLDFRELCADLDIVKRVGATCLMSTPALYDVLLQIQTNRRTDLGRLKLAESGGAVTPPGLVRAFYQTNSVILTPVWGSAETCGVALVNSNPLANVRAFEVLTPYYEASVVVPEQSESTAEGELRLRGPGLSHGYVQAVTREEDPFRDGWYYTGDLCKAVSESGVVFLGRKGDVIKSAGLTVWPSQVEAVLRDVNGVRDALAFGLEDEKRGELLAAAVVRRIPGVPSIGDLVRACKGRLPPYMVPRHIEFVDDLPRDETGKVSRQALRKLITERGRQRPE